MGSKEEAREAPAPRERWAAPHAGARYAGERWSGARRRERDPRHVARLLARHAPGARRVLDAPCGAGRLLPRLARLAPAGRTVGLDVSAPMLAAARAALPPASGGPPGASLVRGDVLRLPFADGSFDAVVCCRLLHHLADAELARAVAELVRVSADLVVVTFWDAAALPEWTGGSRRRPRGRRARSAASVRRAFAAAGAEVLEVAHSLRFVSRQAYAAARKRAPRAGEGA